MEWKTMQWKGMNSKQRAKDHFYLEEHSFSHLQQGLWNDVQPQPIFKNAPHLFLEKWKRFQNILSELPVFGKQNIQIKIQVPGIVCSASCWIHLAHLSFTFPTWPLGAFGFAFIFFRPKWTVFSYFIVSSNSLSFQLK